MITAAAAGQFLLSLVGFAAADVVLTRLRVKNVYYLIHALHNAYIVYLTNTDVVSALTTQVGAVAAAVPPNYEAASAVAALHLYHTILYWDKLRLDDLLHHGLMIGVALPLGCLLPSGPLLGYSLFFSTGLPGGIDYVLLTLVRNGFLAPITEKRVNRWLNVWVRSPGCVSHATLVIANVAAASSEAAWLRVASALPGLLMYWNGQYFMEQVVVNHARRQLDDEQRLDA